MVRNYIRKSDRGSYGKEKLLEAVEKVKSGQLSAYRASIVYNIPRPTIVSRVHERYGLKSNSLGRSTVIPEDIEKKITSNLHEMEKYGYGLSRKEILELIGQYVEINKIENPFKDGIPGEDWFLSFKNRHKLSVKKPQAVENSRKKACNPWIIYPYFELLKKTMDELDLHDKPSQIWNLDETSFSKDPSKTKVVGLKGYASTRTIASPGKDNTTVLLGCSAAGDKTPPLIVFKGKGVYDEWAVKDAYPGIAYVATSNGWMETEVFENFFEKVFLPTVGEKRPILLLYDGHATHVGLNIIEKAREAKITILKLPAHTSDNLQPLDLAVNKSFKDKWDQRLVKWQRLNIGKKLPKKDFSMLIGEIWSQIEREVCAAGFRKAGIFPFNEEVIPENKFQPDQLAEWKKQKRYAELNEILTAANTIEDTGSNLQTIDFKPQPKSSCSQFQPTNNTTVKKDPRPVPSLLSICLTNLNFEECIKTAQDPTEEPAKHDQNIMPSCSKNLPIYQSTSGQSTLNFEECIKTAQDQTEEPAKHDQNMMPSCSKNLPIYQSTSGQSTLNFEVIKTAQDQTEEPAKYDQNIMPSCSKNLPIYQSTSGQSTLNKVNSQKFTILDDRAVKCNFSFEELLLQTIKAGTHVKTKKTRLACGAEIITGDEIYQKQKELKEENLKKKNRMEEKIKRKRLNVTHEDKENICSTENKVNPKLKTKNFKNEVRKNKKKHGKSMKSKNCLRKKTKKRVKTDDSTSDSEVDIKIMDESDLEIEDFLTGLEDFEENFNVNDDEMLADAVIGIEQMDGLEYDDPASSTVHKGQWILVKFSTKTSVKHYVGKVTDVNSDGLPTVNYVRKKKLIADDYENKSTFVFPHVPDECEVSHLEDIVCKLPDPTTGRRGQIFFKMSFRGYNIQ